MRELPQRKSPRLEGYDYSQAGAYFVTMVTLQRQHHFGQIGDGQMILSEMGVIACESCQAIPEYWREQVHVDAFVVMPNHVHIIVFLVGAAFLRPDVVKSLSLSRIINGYKAGITRKCRQQGLLDDSASIWQRGYHDHIIRNEADLNRIREYVANNPSLWDEDSLHS